MAKRKPIVNSRKQPLGVEPERSRRAARGRTTAVETPVEIHAHGLELPETLEPYVHEKLGAKLGAFALQIERVAVRFRDINGPRGGEDTECRIQVVIGGRPDIVVSHLAADARRAFEGANRSAGEAVKRDLARSGYSQGLRATKRRSHAAEPEAEPAPAAAPERKARGSRSKAALDVPKGGGKPGRPSTRKGADSVRSDDKLAKRARDQAHTPKAHATAARAKQQK
jgi:hypothetical protein